jgi:hypothetical protein
VLTLAIARGLDGEPLLRTVARLLFFALLAASALRAWRMPASRPLRFRRRLLSLLAALSHPDAQREYAESTPGVHACEALWTDWTEAVAGLDDTQLCKAFDELELRELRSLREDLSRLGAGLPPWEGQPDDVLQELRFIDTEPAWVAIRRRCLRTFDRFVERTRLPLRQAG